MKTLKIGKSCSPSTIISHESVVVDELTLSYGGGIGGSKEILYITNSKPLGTKNIEVILLNGENITINLDFMVKTREVKLIKVVADITEHLNYHKHTCSKAIETQYILLEHNQKYDFSYEYQSRTNLKVVYSDTVKES